MVTVAGLLWGHGALAIGALLLPPYLVYGDAVRGGVAYRVVACTALLPWTMGSWLASRTGAHTRDGASMASGSAFLTALLVPLIACVLGFAVDAACRDAARRRAIIALGVAAALAGMAVAVQLADGVRADKEYFALVSVTDTPHRSRAVVEGARRFLGRYPYSRWRSEALRIRAMAAEESGDDIAAERLWKAFEESFSDSGVPGVAYAEYSRGRCWERLGRPYRALSHYRRAVAVISVRRDGIQSWIGADGGWAIARLELAEGRTQQAQYWKQRAESVSAQRRD